MTGRAGFSPRSSHTKDSKIVLNFALLNTQNYKVRSRVKLSNPGNGVAPSPTPWCGSYWKKSLQLTLDYGHQLYWFFIQIPGRGHHLTWGDERKKKIKAWLSKTRKLHETKLHCRNLINRINSWALPLLSARGPFLMDQRRTQTNGP